MNYGMEVWMLLKLRLLWQQPSVDQGFHLPLDNLHRFSVGSRSGKLAVWLSMIITWSANHLGAVLTLWVVLSPGGKEFGISIKLSVKGNITSKPPGRCRGVDSMIQIRKSQKVDFVHLDSALSADCRFPHLDMIISVTYLQVSGFVCSTKRNIRITLDDTRWNNGLLWDRYIFFTCVSVTGPVPVAHKRLEDKPSVSVQSSLFISTFENNRCKKCCISKKD